MAFSDNIYRLRKTNGFSEKDLALLFGVSEEEVQAWESGKSYPEKETLLSIAKHFGMTCDELLVKNAYADYDLPRGNEILPDFEKMDFTDSYMKSLIYEYIQNIREGRDAQQYNKVLLAIRKMPSGIYKEKMADVLFEALQNCRMRDDFRFIEPSDLENIRKLRKPYDFESVKPTDDVLRDKIKGAWLGRICGCLLGKPIETITFEELESLLKETNNYPMSRYIKASEITEEMYSRYQFPLRGKCFADTIKYAPWDDDTNYVVMAQCLLEKYGRDFTPDDMAKNWIDLQGLNAYYTAERVAFRNFINGYRPPFSAVYKNPYREMIGAQIRGDYFGYINPGDPEKAAEMAWRDACISHVKNGIYGEMFVAAMIACAAVTDNIEDIIRGGLAQIPETSRLYDKITRVIDDYKNGVSREEAYAKVKEEYPIKDSDSWLHTISNAAIVAIGLLYGEGDFGKSICAAVEVGYDTDCNGATVGSVMGMRNGTSGIGEEWTAPTGGKLDTTIFGIGILDLDEAAEKTMKHLPQKQYANLK